MSDLSRLRARWIRLEKLIDKYDRLAVDLDEDEIPLEKRQTAVVKLEQVVASVHQEELRLFAPDSKLQFRVKSALYD